jgi:hypothetical protein
MKQQNQKKHFQDVYRVVKYCIERNKLFFMSKNEVGCLGEIINLSKTLHSESETQKEVAIASKYHHWASNKRCIGLSWSFQAHCLKDA